MKLKYTFLKQNNVQVEIENEDTHEVIHSEKLHFNRKPTYELIPSIERSLAGKCNTATAQRECFDRTLSFR